MLILRIMLSFMKIGILSFGGAYASVPLVEKEIVEIQQWMSYAEFSDLLALDELTPGPILINSATFVGMKVCGIGGAVAATLGCILPSCLISLLLLMIYRRYRKANLLTGVLHALKCMAIALIFSTFLKIVTNALFQGIPGFKNIDVFAFILITASFLILKKFRFNPLYVMLCCGLFNLIRTLFLL